MKDYTLIFVAEPGAVTMTVNVLAHCTECALKSSLQAVEAQAPRGAIATRCVALFEGRLTNLWPALENELAQKFGAVVLSPEQKEVLRATPLKPKEPVVN